MYKLSKLLVVAIFLLVNAKHGISQFTKKEQKCLATTIYREARGETHQGRIAIGEVVLNRLRAGFGRNVCSVVNSKEFSHSQVKPSQSDMGYFMELSGLILSHKVPVNLPTTVLYFNNRPFKNRKFRFYRKIGKQRFYELT